MSKSYNVWIEIEEHDHETDEHTPLDCPGAAIACPETYEQALALVSVMEAAPDLLAALKALLADLEDADEDRDEEGTVYKTCREAKAAILKAEGGAK